MLYAVWENGSGYTSGSAGPSEGTSRLRGKNTSELAHPLHLKPRCLVALLCSSLSQKGGAEQSGNPCHWHFSLYLHLVEWNLTKALSLLKTGSAIVLLSPLKWSRGIVSSFSWLFILQQARHLFWLKEAQRPKSWMSQVMQILMSKVVVYTRYKWLVHKPDSSKCLVEHLKLKLCGVTLNLQLIWNLFLIWPEEGFACL